MADNDNPVFGDLIRGVLASRRAASSACARPAVIPITSIAVASLRNCISNSLSAASATLLIPIVIVCVVIGARIHVPHLYVFVSI